MYYLKYYTKYICNHCRRKDNSINTGYRTNRKFTLHNAKFNY